MIYPKQLGETASTVDMPTGGEVAVSGYIELYRALTVSQTTASQSLTLPAPFDATVVFGLDVINTGSAAFSLHGTDLPPNNSMHITWDGSQWVTPSSGGGGSVTVVDDDTFATATSSNVPSAESTKAYVDSKSSLNPAVGRVQYGNGTGITGEDALFYNSANNRLGIGTASPSQALDVVRSIECSALVGTGTRQVRATAAGVLTTSTSGAVARAIVAAFKTNAATISSGSPFAVGFNIESIDNGGNFAATSGTFTVPRTGLYRISGSIAFTSATWTVGGEARLGVLVGATNTTYGYVDAMTTSSINMVVTMDTILSLSAGNEVKMTIFQDSGSDKIISTASGRTNKILIEELDSFTN